MRTWDHEIQLIKVVKRVNENGFEVEEKVYKDKILANKLSVRSQEYWQAKQSGIELSHVFEVHKIEYNGERALLYDDEEYTIERTFEKGDYIELVTLGRSDAHGTNH